MHYTADTTATAGSRPLPPTTMRRLPSGKFYLLWGLTGPTENLWQVSRTGERQLTHNPRGREIDSFAVSRAGIIITDALYYEDLLARWTTHGPRWMRPGRKSSGYVHGAVFGFSASGQILYISLSHPVNAATPIVLRSSFTGSAKVIYRQAGFAARAFFGPGGKIAFIGTKRIVIRSPGGALHNLHAGLGRLGPIAWGTEAAGLAVASTKNPTRIFFPSGRYESLPAGWLPLAWSPDGTRLLVISSHSLGVWSASKRRVSVIGPLNRAVQVWEAAWVSGLVRT